MMQTSMMRFVMPARWAQILKTLCLGFFALGLSAAALAQTYPNRPLRWRTTPEQREPSGVL